MPSWMTSQWLANRVPAVRQPVPEQGVEREFALHGEIMCWCASQWPKWIALHGDPSSRTGRTLGEPDFVILAPGCTTILVECKTRTGKLSPDQQALHHLAELNGHTVHIVRSMDDFLCLEDVKFALQVGKRFQEGHHD